MAVFTLTDLQGSCEVVVFPDSLTQFSHLLQVDKILFVKGKVDCTRELPNIIADELINIEQAQDKLSARVKILLNSDDITKEKLTRIKSICSRHKGQSPVYVTVVTDKGKVLAVADRRLSVQPGIQFRKKIKQIVGAGNLELTP